MLLSACGFRCDLCPAFNENVAGKAGQATVSERWRKYWDIDMAPEQIACDGCRSPLNPGRELPARSCETRDCVSKRGLDNCGGCEDYLCRRRENLMRDVERNTEKYVSSISEKEYSKYFEPYDARKHLNKLRDNK